MESHPLELYKQSSGVTKKAIRAINKTFYNDHTNNYFLNMKILKVHEMYESQVAKYYYRLNNGLLPHPLTQVLQFRYQHEHNTRHIIQNYYDTKNLKIVGPVLWNSIPQTIKDSRTIAGFKVKFKNYLLQKYLG